jgi:hypothetical protein
LSVSIDKHVESDEIQKETQNVLADIKNVWKEKQHSHTRSYMIENRDKQVVEWIKQSSKNIEDDIKNWDKEQNPVARSLLNIANKIMGTEK